MCRDCGCGLEHENHDERHAHDHDHDHDHHDHDHGAKLAPRRFKLEANLLAKNDAIAKDLHLRLTSEGITALNLIGAPGAGKTALLEATIRALTDVPLSVIEGDQATDQDARRIAAAGCSVFQVNTGAGCHLDAPMVIHALDHLAPRTRSMLFIENVGNLVCPALFDLGEHAKVVVMSVTEGEDKPLKYPHVFRAASAFVLTKSDLLPHLDVDPQRIFEYARRANAHLAVFPVSAKSGAGMAEWCGWLRTKHEVAA